LTVFDAPQPADDAPFLSTRRRPQWTRPVRGFFRAVKCIGTPLLVLHRHSARFGFDEVVGWRAG